MYKATITSLSPLSGEHVSIIEDDSVLSFFARVTGTVEGICAAGSSVISLVHEGVVA